ncbi:MAG: arginine--tRNA ligase [Faecalibacterium sp.]|jgi:arginyl-tRNA synthetase|nr:arginine--tRNA ligase [Faecalibacterium sp.]
MNQITAPEQAQLAEMQAVYQNFNPRQNALDEARALLTQAAKAAMAAGALPEAELPAFIVEIPADTKNGDIASNLAMAGARAWHKAPRQIADALLAHLPSIKDSCFAKVEIAGPGFINLFLSCGFFGSVVLGACANTQYGRTDFGQGKKINVEFVSANPTGPMHMGNARGGALGDCLASVLDWAGYDVTREFYINDAGNQIQKFGKSLAVRYLQKYKGEDTYPLPAECYQGADIKVLAEEFAAQHGDAYVAACAGKDEDALFESEGFAALKDALIAYALPKNIAGLQRDLAKYRIDYDVWFHESTLHESGAVKAVVDKLLETGACYKAEDGAIMYRSAQYAAKYGTVNKKKNEDGTEEEAKDEVLVRANGIPTYFAADIAYHYNKLAVRGFDKAIDVWGADHHGHVARMKGSMDAIGLSGDRLDVVLMQMVNLMRDGQPVRMSKRTGNAITLTDLLEEVPIDSARFLFNMHDAGSGIDFDLDQAVKADSNNPVYYVKYAHARICSILKKLEGEGVTLDPRFVFDATLLTEPAEMDLIRLLMNFPNEIIQAAEKYDPSRINRFVIELAGDFHKFYNTCRIQEAEPALQQARLALCVAVRGVIRNVLTMFKVTVPEKM